MSGPDTEPIWEVVGADGPLSDEAIRALAALEIPIVTTNYDGLIETVTPLAHLTWTDSAVPGNALSKV